MTGQQQQRGRVYCWLHGRSETKAAIPVKKIPKFSQENDLFLSQKLTVLLDFFKH